MDCSTELQGLVAADCASPAIAGMYGEVTLLPHAGIDRAGSTIENNVISAITMKDGVKGVTFSTLDNSLLGAVSLNAGTYVRTLQHDLTLRIFVKNEQAKAFVNGLVNARVVAIVKNKDGGTGGEATFEAYGWDGGLVLNTITSDTSMTDGVVYELVLGNDDTSKERSVPKSVWDTDLKTTEDMIATLVTA